jgi:hypothetical protein
MTDNHLKNVIATLTATSKVKEGFNQYDSGHIKELISQWLPTDEITEDGYCRGHCELCGKQHTRWGYGIENIHTKRNLSVGSSCIHKFFPELKGHIRQSKQRYIENKIKALLDEIGLREPWFKVKVDDFYSQYKDRKGFTPGQMALVGYRLKKYDLFHSTKWFKVTLRKAKYVDDVHGMEEWKRACVLPYLTSKQRQKLLPRAWLPGNQPSLAGTP